MVIKPEQERVRTLLSDTITLLCRNGLTYKSKFCISAIIGITLDEDEVFLVDIRETIKNAEEDTAADSAASDNETATSPKSPAKRRKRRRPSQDSLSDNDNTEPADNGATRTDDEGEDSTELPSKRHKDIKQELEDDDDSQDLVFIKDEPGSSLSSFSGNMSSSQSYSQQQQSDILGNLAQHGQLFATPASDQLQVPSSGSWDPSSSSQGAAAFNPGQPPSTVTAGAMQGSPSQTGRTPQTTGASMTSIMQELRPYLRDGTCKLCNTRFPSQRNLSAHMITAHGVDVLKVYCPLCHKGYTRKDHMKGHMARVHGVVAKGQPDSALDTSVQGSFYTG